ncbi:epoxide hydrolase family protein [Labedaea rhizosphaerae]|uniref:Microsomal epoxide hydrolase n=1 Tax=Labedaea rhizosphaerae TaxID=598644 RepID=A0A4R6S5R9_LABRH|nr:epoxide hydrolase family protein [Labedaea rhizosphaerae]TDP94085.1 microsomal epoxide hydrolase [Labedaea rhizosphaerae]
MTASIDPFRSPVTDSQLDDLRERLARTRWPDELPGVGWSYGVPGDYLRDLVEHWRTRYDWRVAEASLDELGQFVTELDGQRVHFLHVRSPRAGALPLLITHGWPGSVFEFRRLVPLLTDRFHLVIPSIPGFGFSGPTTETGWNTVRVGRAWARLMHGLGYSRYGVQGGDFGSLIARQTAVADPDGVVGVHRNFLVTFPPSESAPLDLDDEDRRRLALLGDTSRAGYRAIQATRPQTLAYALVDSPVGQLAWNVEWFEAYGARVGVLDRAAVLDHVTLYWLTGTAGSSARLYKESAADWGPLAPLTVPTAVAVFPRDAQPVRKIAELSDRIVRWTEFDRGGHFAAMEVPELLAADISAFFEELA